ncbi:MAG: FAD-dependent oxidoreductase [Alphaproteobacteria bacterium]|nr:FAD-dependent oxidoreductase [Alphaproteobacteria bacterium]
MTKVESQVLIVGAGPVGMTLALDLAQRGIDVVLVEQRGRDDEPRKRCNHISARSLEIFRQLGVASEIRQAGLPADYPQDVAYVTSLTGHELTRIRIPARQDRFGSTGYADSGWPTPEPPHRCNQTYWEPILQRHVLAASRIRSFYATTIEEVGQDGVRAWARGRGGDGEEISFEAEYMVGCDGGSSLVRKAIGARFEGQNVISGTRSVYVRSKELLGKMRVDPAWMTWFLNPETFGCVVALNGDDLWIFAFWLPPGEPDFDSVDPARGIRAAVGADVDIEILSIDDWYGRRLVADRFRDRRLFVCGDSAHIWIPLAGYGMNAGIADAKDLGWQLAAVIAGWGGTGLLDAYEAERQPVTEQVSQRVMALAYTNLDPKLITNPPPELVAEGPEGDAFRARLGRFFYDENVGQFACLGLNFGTYYDGSPVVAYDDESAPGYSLTSYTPTTVPGCRTPHVWLDDGRSLYDAMGLGYTLLRSDPGVDVSALQDAAARRGVPLAVIDLSPVEAGSLYRRKLVLSRPDQHVAWRGDALPDDPLALIDLVRGAGRAEPVQRTAAA